MRDPVAQKVCGLGCGNRYRERLLHHSATAVIEQLEARIVFAAGDPDVLFSSDGRLLDNLDTASDWDIGVDTVMQSDGKVVVAGTTFVAGEARFALARYNRDGSRDAAFGTGGIVVQDVVFGSSHEFARAVGLQSDGKIVVGGYADNGAEKQFVVARFNVDGSFDTSFGFGGSNSSADFSPAGVSHDFAWDLAIDGADRIIVVGETNANFVAGSSWDMAVARYTAGGGLDSDFSGDGITLVDFSATSDDAKAVAIDRLGRILVVGSADTTASFNFAIAKFLDTGEVESVASYDFYGGEDRADAVLAYSHATLGDVIVIGGKADATSLGEGTVMALARLKADLTIDSSFGDSGRSRIAIGGNASIQDLSRQSDGKIVAAGYGGRPPSLTDLAVARVNDNGLVDTTFSGDGVQTTAFTGHDSAGGVVIDDEGKIVLGGVADLFGGNIRQFAAARYEAGQYAYRGVAAVVGQVIQAEDFDNGGQGISYSDNSSLVNDFGAYRGTGVDVAHNAGADDGTPYIANFGEGEWLEYTVDVPSSGTYQLDLRVASAWTGARSLRVSANGSDLAGSLAYPNTGGWETFQTISTTVTLAAGENVLRVTEELGAHNLNWLRLSLPTPGDAEVITFDDLAATTIVTEQYADRGVDFNAPSQKYRVRNVGADGLAESGAQVLEFEPAPGTEFWIPSIAATLTITATHLSVSVGAPARSVAGEARVTLRGFDHDGNVVATSGPIPVAAGVHTRLAITASNIVAFDISASSSDLNYPFAIDDLTIVPAEVQVPFFNLNRTEADNAVFVAPGGTATDDIEIQRGGGSSGGIDFSVTGNFPPGITWFFTPDPASGGSTVLNIAADSSVIETWGPVGAVTYYDVTITGTPLSAAAGAAADTTAIRLYVRRNFRLSAEPNPAVLAGSVEVPITVERTLPFNGDVALSISGVPAGMTASLSQTIVTAADYSGGGAMTSVTLALTADQTVPIGPLILQITASSGAETITYDLTVNNIVGQITGITPVEGKTPQLGNEGTLVTLRGLGLRVGSTVRFGNSVGNDWATPESIDSDGTELKVRIPRLATSGPIWIQIPDGRTFSSANDFFVNNYRNTNGYSFENLSGLDPYDFKDLVDVYGVQAFSSIDLCMIPSFGLVSCPIPTPFPSPLALLYLGLSDLINELGGGQCSGMSLSSLRMLYDDKAITDFELATGATRYTIWNLKDPDPAGPPADLKQYIHLRQLQYSSAEFLRHYLEQIVANEAEGLSNIRDMLQLSFDRGEVAFLNFSPGSDLSRAHTVIAYDMEETPDGMWVYVWDNNVPFLEEENDITDSHQSRFNRSRFFFESDGDWSYKETGWTGGPGNMCVTPYSTFNRSTLAGSFEGLRLIIKFGAAAVTQVTDASGRTLLAPGGTLNTDPTSKIPNSAVYSALNPGVPMKLFGDAGSYTQTVQSTSEGEYQTLLVGPSFGAKVTTRAGAAGETDLITFDDSSGEIAFTPQSSDRSLAVQLIGRSADNRERVADVTLPASTGAQEGIAFSDDRASIVIEHAGAAGDITVTLSQVSDTGALQSFSTSRLRVEAGDRVTLSPASWSDLANGTVTAVIVHANGDEEIRSLTNSAVALADTGVEAKRTHLDLARFTLPDGVSRRSLRATIEWGDGTTSRGVIRRDGNGVRVQGTHRYRNEGYFAAVVKLTERGAAVAQTTAPISVTNAALTAGRARKLTALHGTQFSGTVATFRNANRTEDLSNFVATIDWGDGTTSAGTLEQNVRSGRISVVGEHTYAVPLDEVPRPVNVRLVDQYSTGAAGMPIVVPSGDFAFEDQVSHAILPVPGTSTADYATAVNWGDGLTSAGTLHAHEDGLLEVEGSHVFSAAGTFSPSYTLVGGPSATVDGTIIATPLPDLRGEITSQVPATAAKGASGTARARIINNGNARLASGRVDVDFFLSTDTTLDDGDTLLLSRRPRLQLAVGQGRTVEARFRYPQDVPDGDYYILCALDRPGAVDEKDDSDNVAASAGTVSVAAPFVDLAGSVTPAATTLTNEDSLDASVVVQNDGNISGGPSRWRVVASADDVVSEDDVIVFSGRIRRSVAPGAIRSLSLSKPVRSLGLSAGTYRLIADLDTDNDIVETDEANNRVFSEALITIA